MVITSSRINYTTLISQAHKNIFNVINNRSNVVDPRNVNSNSNRTFVYLIDPFHKSFNFNDMPYIVVNMPTKTQSVKSLNGYVNQINWKQKIIIRTLYDGAAQNQDGKGLDDSWSITNDLEQTFNDETIKQSLREYDMYDMKLTLLSNTPTTYQDKSVIEIEYELAYQTRTYTYHSVPVASTTGTTLSGNTGATFTLDGRQSTGYQLQSYTWTIDRVGGGYSSTATGSLTSKVLNSAGTYTVVLTVTDLISRTDTDTCSIVVSIPGP